METQLILTTNAELRSLLREELQAISNEQSNPRESNDQILKRTDVAELFDISLVTVHAWMKSGLLPFHRMGGKTYFKKEEVFNSMKQIKIRKKQAA